MWDTARVFNCGFAPGDSLDNFTAENRLEYVVNTPSRRPSFECFSVPLGGAFIPMFTVLSYRILTPVPPPSDTSYRSRGSNGPSEDYIFKSQRRVWSAELTSRSRSRDRGSESASKVSLLMFHSSKRSGRTSSGFPRTTKRRDPFARSCSSRSWSDSRRNAVLRHERGYMQRKKRRFERVQVRVADTPPLLS